MEGKLREKKKGYSVRYLHEYMGSIDCGDIGDCGVYVTVQLHDTSRKPNKKEKTTKKVKFEMIEIEGVRFTKLS